MALTFDAAGLNEGAYTTTLTVFSNDADDPAVPVAVRLTVVERMAYPAHLPLVWRGQP
jgi:hypothetical protein